MPITQSVIKKEFFMTCRPDQWVLIAKEKEALQQLQPNSEDDNYLITSENMPKDEEQ